MAARMHSDAADEAGLGDAFRAAMRRQGSTVALVTAGRDNDVTGMAATAITAVCADPPSLAIGVNRSASVHALVCRYGAFSVNFLRRTHAGMIKPFTGELQGASRFAVGDWRPSSQGAPVLNGALASLVCIVEASLDYGSHTLFIGRVHEVSVSEVIDPLLWVDGVGCVHSLLDGS